MTKPQCIDATESETLLSLGSVLLRHAANSLNMNPSMVAVALCGGEWALCRPLWWWVGPVCRDRNKHQTPGSSYVSDTAPFELYE